MKNKNKSLNVLCVNPWIHDFAAYDFWSKPLGFLWIVSILKLHGISVSYIDCLDRFHPKIDKHSIGKDDGRGPYLKTKILTPKPLNYINRNYSRYGINPEWFKSDLLNLSHKPDLIFVTSIMTYWYTGVQETIGAIREVYPNTSIILGGIYASLCYEHALKYSGADIVISGPGEKKVLELVEKYTGFVKSFDFDPDNLDTYPYPAFELQNKITYIPILTSKGCPFSCSYCASNYLSPNLMVRSPDSVISEIKHWNLKYGVKNFALYDDAFLINSKNHAIPILEKIIAENLDICFHTPNALHAREISKLNASLMFKANFKTIRIGVETLDFNNRGDHKLKEDEFKNALFFLKEAGFTKEQVGAYLLVGLPDQDLESIENSILNVKALGINPILAYYTPIPHTAMWTKAIESSRYDLVSDPIFSNNSIFPCWKSSFDWIKVSNFKNIIR
ncbi:MAG: B12-binding domain-containing radical SAM protein [Desulfobacterales bacterium]|nr:B12-binding domain-containing radical SAM protein [Desulfobacterales bacterium]